MKTETKIKEFRIAYSNYHNSYNRRYFPNHLAKLMLNLINLLESEFIHDSDCAVHNEPATPNGSCDCRLSVPSKEDVTDPDLRKEVQELFNSKGFVYPEDMHLQKDVEDIYIKHLLVNSINQ